VRSGDRLDWACGFGGFTSGGTVATIEDAKAAIAPAFRVSLARVGLTEIDDARPGPPVRKVPSAVVPGGAFVPRSTPEWWDRDHPVVIHQPRRMGVKSGELLVGLSYARSSSI
jgi:hypothetical protein